MSMLSASKAFDSSISRELPPLAPRKCYGHNELIEKVVGLAEDREPIALSKNNQFMCCDQFTAL